MVHVIYPVVSGQYSYTIHLKGYYCGHDLCIAGDCQSVYPLSRNYLVVPSQCLRPTDTSDKAYASPNNTNSNKSHLGRPLQRNQRSSNPGHRMLSLTRSDDQCVMTSVCFIMCTNSSEWLNSMKHVSYLQPYVPKIGKILGGLRKNE